MSGWEIAGFIAGGVSVWLYVRRQWRRSLRSTVDTSRAPAVATP